MVTHSLRAALGANLMAAALAAQAQPPVPTPNGRWLTESGNLEVEIAPCGGALCGAVVKVLADRSMSAPTQPMQAADPRPALGMQILSGLRSSGDEAFTGEIYNRENAKTYSVQITMDGPQQMLVRPYVGMPLFGKTQLWRRVGPTDPSASVDHD